MLVGAAALLPFAAWLRAPQAFFALLWTLSLASLLHLLMVWGEVTLTHPTAHARLATWEMTRGRYRRFFRVGFGLTFIGAVAPWLSLMGDSDVIVGLIISPFALAGLLLYEHAYVQAGQSVPLA